MLGEGYMHGGDTVNNLEAKYGTCLLQDGTGGPLKGLGLQQNDAEAVKWFRKAANQGLCGAQHSLGIMYEEGRGVPKDTYEALEWYRKAANQDDYWARKNYDRMLTVVMKGVSSSGVKSWTQAEAKYEPKGTGEFLLGNDGVFICAYLEVTQRLSPGEFLVSFPTNPPRYYHCTIPSYIKLNNLVTGRAFKAIVKTGGIYEYMTTAGSMNSVQTINVLYAESLP